MSRLAELETGVTWKVRIGRRFTYSSHSWFFPRSRIFQILFPLPSNFFWKKKNTLLQKIKVSFFFCFFKSRAMGSQNRKQKKNKYVFWAWRRFFRQIKAISQKKAAGRQKGGTKTKSRGGGTRPCPKKKKREDDSISLMSADIKEVDEWGG